MRTISSRSTLTSELVSEDVSAHVHDQPVHRRTVCALPCPAHRCPVIPFPHNFSFSLSLSPTLAPHTTLQPTTLNPSAISQFLLVLSLEYLYNRITSTTSTLVQGSSFVTWNIVKDFWLVSMLLFLPLKSSLNPVIKKTPLKYKLACVSAPLENLQWLPTSQKAKAKVLPTA